MIFYRSLTESKSPWVSRTLLSILAYCSSVSILPLISTHSSSPLSLLMGTIPSAPTIIDTKVFFFLFFLWSSVNFMFHSFISSLARSKYLSIFSFSFIFPLCSYETAKYTKSQGLFLLLINMRFRLPAWINRISKSQRILWISFSRTVSGLCLYHL